MYVCCEFSTGFFPNLVWNSISWLEDNAPKISPIPSNLNLTIIDEIVLLAPAEKQMFSDGYS